MLVHKVADPTKSARPTWKAAVPDDAVQHDGAHVGREVRELGEHDDLNQSSHAGGDDSPDDLGRILLRRDVVSEEQDHRARLVYRLHRQFDKLKPID